jgi:hypothetical protein
MLAKMFDLKTMLPAGSRYGQRLNACDRIESAIIEFSKTDPILLIIPASSEP